MTTLHANSVRDAMSRLETMIMMAGFELPIKAMRQQIASAVDLIIQANRLQGGPRKITSITEVMNMEQDVIIMQEIFRFKQLGVDQNGRAFGQFEATGVRPTFVNRLEAKGVKLPSTCSPSVCCCGIELMSPSVGQSAVRTTAVGRRDWHR